MKLISSFELVSKSYGLAFMKSLPNVVSSLVMFNFYGIISYLVLKHIAEFQRTKQMN